jgi:hypothetical protein
MISPRPRCRQNRGISDGFCVQPYGTGEKTYARVDRPEAVHSPNPTPVDYRALVDPAWYPAQKTAFQHIDEFLRNSDDYSIRDMIQDSR